MGKADRSRGVESFIALCMRGFTGTVWASSLRLLQDAARPQVRMESRRLAICERELVFWLLENPSPREATECATTEHGEIFKLKRLCCRRRKNSLQKVSERVARRTFEMTYRSSSPYRADAANVPTTKKSSKAHSD